VELLNFADDGVPRFLLDVGCGSGLSGDRLTELGRGVHSFTFQLNLSRV